MRTINKLFLIVLALASFSCEDILEEDITDDMVQIVSPSENAVIESNVVNFRWNSIKGAASYRIQLYGSGQSMVFDTLVNTVSSFTHPVRGGSYQWRIRAENSAYQSSYTFPSNFTVVETDDLDGQQVILSAPGNGIFFGNTAITCSWQVLTAADKYEFELTNTTNGNVFTNAELTRGSLILPANELESDARYTWKVKASNSFSHTPFSVREFSIDRVSPNQPQNLLPANSSRQSANLQLDFTWNMPPDSGNVQSPIRYTIEFSRDASFLPVIQSSTTLNANFQQIFSQPGDYYWRVKAQDEANNTGSYSTSFKFTVN